MIFGNKKAMIFTLLTIVILFVFLLGYGLYSVVNEEKAVNRRIESMNNFVFSTEKDLQRQIYISGFRIILILEKKIVDTGTGISDLNSSFEECFFNGTLDNQHQNLMDDANFSYISHEINERAKKMNMEANLTFHEFYVIQDDPWHVKINLVADILIRDKGNLAFWNKTETVSSYISIENFEDPLYRINIHIPNRINKTIYRPFVKGGDYTNLTIHAENSYYIESNNTGPSFLDRLEGKTTPSPNGIESIVNTQKIPPQIPVRDKSCVDYIYFSVNNPAFTGVVRMPSWFKLDNNHLTTYLG
jgi:hypothetical protein